MLGSLSRKEWVSVFNYLIRGVVVDWLRWQIQIPIKACILCFFIVLTPSLVIFTKQIAAITENHGQLTINSCPSRSELVWRVWVVNLTFRDSQLKASFEKCVPLKQIICFLIAKKNRGLSLIPKTLRHNSKYQLAVLPSLES